MSNKFLKFATVLSALTSMVIAVPASTRSVPEVIPGPGLPTLESLGLTSEELYAIGPTALLGERSAEYTAVCEQSSTAAVNDVIACFNYLVSIGNNNCVVDSTVGFCESGTALILGDNVSGTSSASSSCYDVALAVQWVFTYCNSDGNVGGSNAANGNGNLIVYVERS